MMATAKMQACLFDLDGVLVDTAQYHYLAWRTLANALGFDISPEQNEQLKGVSRMESLDRILAWGNVSLPDRARTELAECKNEHYVKLVSQMPTDAVLPGAIALLDALRAAGVRTALGSASKNAELILQNCGLDRYMDAVVDGNRVTKSKPDPEVFLRGAQELHVPPQFCVVFEDAMAGIVAAKRAGMKAVGVGNPADLQQADWVVPDLTAVTFGKLQQLFNRT